MKLYFLFPQESSLASREISLLASIKARLLSLPNIVLAGSPNDADAILIHEEFSFKEWRYIRKLLADPIVGTWPHKTYTINTDDIASGLLRGVYTSLPRDRFHPGIHRAVPYAWYPNEKVLECPQATASKPKFLAAWRGNVSSNIKLRKKLIKICCNSSSMLAEVTQTGFNRHDDVEKKKYVDVVRSGQFSLCPAGWAPASWRIYESMAMGVSPVIIADSFVCPRGPDWGSFSIRIQENCLPHLESMLGRFSPNFKKMGKLARENWERFFMPDKVIDYYCAALLDCMRFQPQFSSREREVQRWKSWRMHWSNKWTLVQRLTTRVSNRLTIRC